MSSHDIQYIHASFPLAFTIVHHVFTKDAKMYI